MSWSLQLRHGDVFHQGGRFATIQGPAKIAQDLRIWILTRMGTMELNPDFGSLLDVEDSLIGSLDFNVAALEIETELRRWETEYKATQLTRMQREAQTYGRTTLRRDEILQALSSINFSQVSDTLHVRVTIQPVSGTPEIIDIPVLTTA